MEAGGLENTYGLIETTHNAGRVVALFTTLICSPCNGGPALGLALFTSRYFAVKRHAVDDSRYGPCNVTNLTPPGSECNPKRWDAHESCEYSQQPVTESRVPGALGGRRRASQRHRVGGFERRKGLHARRVVLQAPELLASEPAEVARGLLGRAVYKLRTQFTHSA